MAKNRGLQSSLGAIAILAAIAAGGYLFHQYSGRRSAAATIVAIPPVPVTTAAAEARDMPLFVRGIGTVQAYNQAIIKTRRRKNSNFGIILLQIDRYETMREAYGQSFCDNVQRVVAQRIVGILRMTDTLTIMSDTTMCILVDVMREDTDLVAVGEDAERWLGIAQAFAGPPGEGRAAVTNGG